MAMGNLRVVDDDEQRPSEPRREWEVMLWIVVTAGAITVTVYRVLALLG